MDKGGLACCSPWGCKESDMTERLNCTEGFPGGSDNKESACNAGDLGSLPGLERSGGGNGNPLQHSGLKDCMNRGAWQAAVHGVAKSQTWLK